MSFLNSLNISGSGMTAQRLRMDTISENIANSKVTRTRQGTPYRRKVVVMDSLQGMESRRESFRDVLNSTMGIAAAARGGRSAGVQIRQILEDPAPLVPVYDPSHPDANREGYVMMPNVNMAQEMVDAMGASRAYESNVTAFNATKAMLLKALEIGR